MFCIVTVLREKKFLKAPYISGAPPAALNHFIINPWCFYFLDDRHKETSTVFLFKEAMHFIVISSNGP
jgi:hypothetical protein